MLDKVQTAAPFFVMSIAAVLVSMAVMIFKHFGPTLLINETRSEPLGFYRLVRHSNLSDYRRGMYVVFPVPPELQALVYGRGWLKNGIPFLKELLGVAGDKVCVWKDRLEINQRYVGPVFQFDGEHHALPQHLGCFAVPHGYFFAASEYFEKSFDGRYFGSLPLTLLSGEARPLWTF
jgi:conjugative transfer signal peptidase TraF